MRFLVEIDDVEEMKRQILEAEGAEYEKDITDYDYISLVDSSLNMFNLGATFELLEEKEEQCN